MMHTCVFVYDAVHGPGSVVRVHFHYTTLPQPLSISSPNSQQLRTTTQHHTTTHHRHFYGLPQDPYPTPKFASPRRSSGMPYAQPLLIAHVPTERPGPAPGSSVQRGYTSSGYNLRTFAPTFSTHYFPHLLHWGHVVLQRWGTPATRISTPACGPLPGKVTCYSSFLVSCSQRFYAAAPAGVQCSSHPEMGSATARPVVIRSAVSPLGIVGTGSSTRRRTSSSVCDVS